MKVLFAAMFVVASFSIAAAEPEEKSDEDKRSDEAKRLDSATTVVNYNLTSIGNHTSI